MNNNPNPDNEPEVVKLGDFLARDIPAPIDTVPGLVTPGVSLLAGAPKTGKSLLAEQLAGAVASGGKFLGWPTRQGPVLFVNLEGSESSLHGRLKVLTAGEIADNASDEFNLVTQPDNVSSLGAGLEEWIDLQIQNLNLRLVVIDTLVRVTDSTTAKQWATQYERDAKVFERLVKVANRHPDTSIVFVTHSRESKAADSLDSIYGSRGLTASINDALILTRFHDFVDDDNAMFSKDEASHRLIARLRDGNDTGPPLALRRTGLTYRVVEEMHISEVRNLRELIIETMRDRKEPMRGRDIASETGENPQSIRQTLVRMANAGRIRKNGTKYWLPGTNPPPDIQRERFLSGDTPLSEIDNPAEVTGQAVGAGSTSEQPTPPGTAADCPAIRNNSEEARKLSS